MIWSSRFLRIAQGSANELEYEPMLARDLAYVDSEVHTDLARDLDEVKRMIAVLESRLRRHQTD